MNEKVVVFDLDETIGYFTQVGVLFDTIELFINTEIKFDIFCKIFDLYPEIFRTNIFTIFNYLKRIKDKKNIKIMIYTNNQADKKWCINISNIIEKKINFKLFDYIIHAYKIGNKVIERCRTSHEKKYNDLVKCANLSNNVKVCFIDDQLHKAMKNHKSVFYINIKPYNYQFDNDVFFYRFFKSNIFNEIIDIYKIKNRQYFITFIENHFRNIKFIEDKCQDDIKNNKLLTKKIMYHIQRFINSNNTTKKKKTKKNNLTRKKKVKN